MSIELLYLYVLNLRRLFTTVLIAKLIKLIDKTEIRAGVQNGFRKGYYSLSKVE